MIGVLPPKLKAAMLGGAGAATSKSGAGFFVGASAPTSYVTVQYQPQWWLNEAGNVGDPVPGNIPQSQLPLRYFTWADYYANFANTNYELAIPNVKQVVYDDQLSEDASTLTVQIYNIRPQFGETNPYAGANDVGNQGAVFGDPGYMSYLYGGLDPTSTAAQTLFWGRGANTSGWAGLIREGALLRWYFGYGGLGPNSNTTVANWTLDYPAGYVMLKGLFNVDQVDVEANTGLITLTCRCQGGKLLLDQFLYPPLVPHDEYSSSGIEFIPPMPITYYKVPKYGAPGETTAIHPVTGVATNAITTGRTKDGRHKTVIDSVVSDNGLGYMMASEDGATFGYSGTVFGYGGLPPAGESGAFHLIGKIIGMDQAPLSAGYWLCDERGTVYNYGTSNFNCLNSGIPASTAPNTTTTTNNTLDYGYVNQLPGNGVVVSGGQISLTEGANNLVVAFRANSTGEGYWMVTQNGTIYTFGAAGKITVLTGPSLTTTQIVSATYFTLSTGGTSSTTLDCMYLLDNAGTVYPVGGINQNLGDYSYTPIPGVVQTSGRAMPYSGPCAIEANVGGAGYWILGSVPYPTVPNTGVIGQYSMVLQSFGSIASFTPPAIGGVAWTETNGIWVSPPVNAPAWALRISSDGNGLYIFGTDGSVYTMGDALFFGSLPAEYTLWIPSNYVSFYNTDVYMIVPDGIQAPAGAKQIPTITSPVNGVDLMVSYAPGAYASPTLLSADYSQVVRLIWLWAGGFLPSTDELVTPGTPPEWSYTVTFDAATNPNAAPPLLGAIFDSGAFDCQPSGTLVSVVVDPPMEHGYPKTYNVGCRCDECIEAHKASWRAWYKKSRGDQFSHTRSGHDSEQDEQQVYSASFVQPGRRSYVELRPIEDVRVGDRVLSLTLHDAKGKRTRNMLKRKNHVQAVRSMPFNGELIEVKTSGGYASRYTPNHRCVVHIGDALLGKQMVYLMKKGSQYRIGRTSCKAGGMGSLVSRLATQQGDAIWVLSVFNGIPEAALQEMIIAHQFNIPKAPFREIPGTRKTCAYDVDAFWQFVGDNTDQATACLVHFGRDIQYPFFVSKESKQHDPGLHIQRACNLLDGMKVLTAPGDAKGLYFQALDKAEPIIIQRVPYVGNVYSLLVEDDHTYVADHIITGNSLGPIDSSTFDKVSAKQGINAMRDAIGFITRFRDDGGLVFNLPNLFRAGNFFEDQTYMASQVPGAPGTGTNGALGAYSWNASAIPTFGEGAELPLQDFTLSSLDAPLRSQIIVTPIDPAIYDNSPPFPNMQNTPLGTSSTITSLTPSTAAANILHGLIKVSMLGVPLNVPISVGDQDLMAEYEYIQSWCATRVGTLVAPFNPQITTDTQIRIIDRVTGETGIHYVTGISVTHNLDQGDCLATYTTQWMGDVDNAWQVGAGITNATFNSYGVQTNTTTYSLSSALANAINVWLSVNVPQGYLNSFGAFAV